mgnify:CR=1 FL=1
MIGETVPGFAFTEFKLLGYGKKVKADTTGSLREKTANWNSGLRGEINDFVGYERNKVSEYIDTGVLPYEHRLYDTFLKSEFSNLSVTTGESLRNAASKISDLKASFDQNDKFISSRLRANLLLLLAYYEIWLLREIKFNENFKSVLAYNSEPKRDTLFKLRKKMSLNS